MRRTLPLLLLLPLCAGLSAAAAPKAAPPSDALVDFEIMRDLHVEQLIAFALSIDAPDKSLPLEVRDDALALARKLDPKSPRLKIPKATARTATAEELATDVEVRAAIAAREQARTAAEAGHVGDGDGGGEPADLKDEFEAIRCEVLAEQVDFAEELSLDPRTPAVLGLRQAILRNAQGALGKPRWRREVALKERIARALTAQYLPWSGDWMTADKGPMILTQKGDKVTGTFDGGKIAGIVKDGTLMAQWKGDKGPPRECTLTLADDERSCEVVLTAPANGPNRFTATRQATDSAKATAK